MHTAKLKTLAGETVLYGLGSILPRVINFLLVPLHTINMFSQAQYGHITTLYAVVAFVNVVFMFGMETAYFRFATKPGADTQRVFNLVQTVVVFISCALSILIIVLATPIASVLKVEGRAEWIIWLALTMLIDALVAVPFAQLRLEKKAAQFALAKIANVLVLVGLNFIFLKVIYHPTVGIGYVMLANLVANSFFILFFVKTLLKWRPAFDKVISPSMVHYAYPIMLTGLAGMTNEMFSRLTLESWLPTGFYSGLSNEAVLGVFGACYKYSVFMNLGIQAFRYAAEPFFFSSARENKSRELYSRVNHFFIITGCVFFLAISINLDVLKYFIGNQFWSGLGIVPILLLAYLFLGIYYNISIWFKLIDKTYFGTVITVAGALITIVANYFLIPLYGYIGSAIAALICYGSMTIFCFALGQKFYPVPYRVTSGLTYLVGTSLVIFLINSIEINQLWISVGFHCIVIALFLGVVWMIERKELLGKA